MRSALKVEYCKRFIRAMLAYFFRTTTAIASHHQHLLIVYRRTWLGATIHDGCIYAVGGFDGANRLTSVERYDPRIDRWDIISEISIPRSGMGVASL